MGVFFPNYKIIVFKYNKNDIIYSYNLKEKKKQIFLSEKKQSNIYKNTHIHGSVNTTIYNTNNTFSDYYFKKLKKIKFKSKCFRVKYYKKRRLIKFLFGYSHFNWLFINKINIKKRGKYKYVLRHYNEKFIYKFCKKFIKLRPHDPYTGRGCRMNKQIVFRKKGKK